MKFIDAIKLLYNFFDIKEERKNHTYFIQQIAIHCVPEDIELSLQTYGSEIITQLWNDRMSLTEDDAIAMQREWADGRMIDFLKKHFYPDDEGRLFQALVKNGYKGEEKTKEMICFCNELLYRSAVGRIPIAKCANTDSISERVNNLLKEFVNTLPAPTPIEIPSEEADEEMIYIGELYKAYSDEAGCEINRDNIKDYADYEDDLSERRIHYFAAESIRRSLEELDIDELDGQFEVLKKETLTGVKDTWRRHHENGYQRMLAVMDKAVEVQVTSYILSTAPNWISNDIRKGVCHFLVKDGALYWVKKRG